MNGASQPGPNGGARFKFDRDAIVTAIVEGCSNGAEDVIIRVQANIRKNLARPGTGIWHPGAIARSSAPGKPPATQTGRLQNAWQAKPKRFGKGRTIGWVLGVGRVPYARILEFGGKTGRNKSTKIAERPYLRPALIAVLPEAATIFAGYIEIALRRALDKTSKP